MMHQVLSMTGGLREVIEEPDVQTNALVVLISIPGDELGASLMAQSAARVLSKVGKPRGLCLFFPVVEMAKTILYAIKAIGFAQVEKWLHGSQ